VAPNRVAYPERHFWANRYCGESFVVAVVAQWLTNATRLPNRPSRPQDKAIGRYTICHSVYHLIIDLGFVGVGFEGRFIAHHFEPKSNGGILGLYGASLNCQRLIERPRMFASCKFPPKRKPARNNPSILKSELEHHRRFNLCSKSFANIGAEGHHEDEQALAGLV
jgi:hypothetical protein